MAHNFVWAGNLESAAVWKLLFPTEFLLFSVDEGSVIAAVFSVTGNWGKVVEEVGAYAGIAGEVVGNIWGTSDLDIVRGGVAEKVKDAVVLKAKGDVVDVVTYADVVEVDTGDVRGINILTVVPGEVFEECKGTE